MENIFITKDAIHQIDQSIEKYKSKLDEYQTKYDIINNALQKERSCIEKELTDSVLLTDINAIINNNLKNDEIPEKKTDHRPWYDYIFSLPYLSPIATNYTLTPENFTYVIEEIDKYLSRKFTLSYSLLTPHFTSRDLHIGLCTSSFSYLQHLVNRIPISVDLHGNDLELFVILSTKHHPDLDTTEATDLNQKIYDLEQAKNAINSDAEYVSLDGDLL